MKCYVLKCESKTSLNRARQYCHFHKLKFRTLKDKIVVYEKLKKEWSDIAILEAKELKDKIGQLYYI